MYNETRSEAKTGHSWHTKGDEHLRTTLPEAERFLKGRSPLADYLLDQFG